jgi:NADH-quinone oxidoreductase subunit F
MQTNVLLRNVGVVNSHQLDTYLRRGGYQALTKALREHTPSEVVRSS